MSEVMMMMMLLFFPEKMVIREKSFKMVTNHCSNNGSKAYNSLVTFIAVHLVLSLNSTLKVAPLPFSPSPPP